MKGPDRQCKQCGTCCRKGGPILHREDLPIIVNGSIPHEHLVTIRIGEPVLHPLRVKPEKSRHEMTKISGQGSDWICRFFSEDKNSCSIYQFRPLECRLLKCWDTEELEEIIGQDTLSRSEIISHDHPVLPLIKRHDKECLWNICLTLAGRLTENPKDEVSLSELTLLVRRDLAIRSAAVKQFDLSVDIELFYFGRPLFTALHVYGLEVNENGADINLQFAR